MFTGTAVYRADVGQTRWRVAGAAIAVVLAATIVAVYAYGGMWHMADADRFPVHRSWLTAILLAGVVFAAAMLLRRFRFPRLLSWIGMISYSVYLSHQLLIYILDHWLQDYRSAPVGTKLFVVSIFMVTTLAVSRLLFEYVEIPFQRLGRRVIAWVEARSAARATPDDEQVAPIPS